MTNIFYHFEKETTGSISFNGKIINMKLPTKVRITGPILESKGICAIFQKKGKKE